ncbi:MAG TPA: fibronectin type III domain-containing protein, partial [Verrucomicrobiae bacterium]|nr:fibronectin type III domain-containing protein [Verrucomicrobiae bacterium]
MPSTNHAVLARPFLTLDPGALRAAKLRAAAIASRGNRGPSAPTRTPLAGLFNNINRSGLSQPTVAPPDSTGAIGPNNYVEMVNQEIGVYDRSLNLLSSTDNGTFTGAAGAASVSDPQVQWDGQAGRWLYAALGVATGANILLFGWSKTSDPSDLTNGWCRFGIDRANMLDDYPKLGHDNNFLSIGTNVYNDSTLTFITANIWAIRKPAVGDTSCSVGTASYVADATHVLHNADGSTAFTPVPANTADASAFGYIVAAHSPVDGIGPSAPKIMVWHWALVSGLPALMLDGDVAVSTFAIPAPVPQPGTSDTLDSLDARLTQAVAVNDPGAGGAKGIWTQHTVAGPGGRSVVRWYEILGGAPPALRQQGDVGSPTDFVFNGAISPSIGGDSAAVFYNRAGASTLAVIGAQTRSASTPLSSLDAGELVIGQSSAADLDFTCGYTKPTDPCRWGDYAGASPDPANAGVIWGSSQLTGPCVIFCGFFAQWQTQNFAVVASTSSSPVPPGPPTLNTPTAGNASVGLSWSAPSSNGGATITDYSVYRATSSGGETFLANTGGALTYTDTAVSNGTTYFYKVAAINSAGTGALSNEVSATPTAPPPPP